MAPMDFNHPYTPYPIQQQFMTAVYECIQNGKIGIFESPTGTGKSLSLICGSLTWLRQHKRDEIEAAVDQDGDNNDEPDWMLEHAKKERRIKALQHRQELEERLARIREKERKLKKRYDSGEPLSKRQKLDHVTREDALDENRFVLDDYDSDSETKGGRLSASSANYGFSSETQAILKRLGLADETHAHDEDNEMPDELKVFYCSRTHSQLSQFSNELRRVRLPPVIDADQTDMPDEQVEEELKHLTLGSRKNLCINPKVNKLSSATAINERCLELQQSKTSDEQKCTFLPNKDNQALVNEFRDRALAEIQDIEDLGNVGRKVGICPYYATRAAVRPSEIVTLPYPLLLQKAARKALDLSLKDHVIIIDEAHNLMDAIAGMYSASISLKQLELGRAQLMTYLQKFRNRLKGSNRVYVTQIVRVIDSLIAYSKASKTVGAVSVGTLLSGKGVDQINMFKLSKYITESRLARKVDGYVDFADSQEQQIAQSKMTNGKAGERPRERSTPVLALIENFLMALMNPSKEGRFFSTQAEDGPGPGLQYMLLDPTYHFREVVDEARAIILAGGTMSPMDDYIKHLFSYVPRERIMTLSCDHVIPSSSLLACAMSKDGQGNEFNFTFQNRNSPAVMQSAGRTLLELIREIPDGVVAFFSSYSYLDACVKAWKQSLPSGSTLWAQLNAMKPVFLEPRSGSADQNAPKTPVKTAAAATEALLSSYAAAIQTTSKGALLLSVINGSLSEGINFSDRLGRAVVVFGLPFPNPHSPEWKAKMEYIASKEVGVAEGKQAAQDFYENATMRAVNQAVGRAIRHKGDWASIYLIDRRYDSERIRNKLPGWIKGSLKSGLSMKEVLQSTGKFFAAKKGT